ncbi:hypothetical protein MRO89_02050 [Dickeya dianthicola]|uniref:hypothetical protein n=1 Tax=Dickeya dianthicola TaxID=204039 RepID=UPI001F61031F|nr:hypothetical protein [Dickeya dianthicola]MCI4184752.1 hypothetical protein [Dickeya dianthicola]
MVQQGGDLTADPRLFVSALAHLVGSGYPEPHEAGIIAAIAYCGVPAFEKHMTQTGMNFSQYRSCRLLLDLFSSQTVESR